MGVFRFLFGLITLQEIFFLIYFNHLIFDPIPFLDVEFPMVPFFAYIWGIVAFALMIGYRSQQCAVANYLFWIVFVNFTPMQRDFDGGFDVFMIGTNFFLMFMPIEKSFSIDGLRKKLATPFVHYSAYKPDQISVLSVTLPIVVCLGFLYFDSAIHKLSAPHWRNGLGAWVPASMPYYISAIDFSWLLNNELLQKIIGYTIIVFQFTFLLGFSFTRWRPWYFLVGVSLHLGITLVLNIYPFGLGMLVWYALVAPASWYRQVGDWIRCKTPRLTVFYDEKCPLCNRTVLILNHFDIFSTIDFKGAQTFAVQYQKLAGIDQRELMRDLYALDNQGNIYAGVATYANILKQMRYTFLCGWLLSLPGIKAIAEHYYRKIADSRERINCDDTCEAPRIRLSPGWYDQLLENNDNKLKRRNLDRICKVLVLLMSMQLNSTLHYAILYRLGIDTNRSPLTQSLAGISNTLALMSTTFWGITPHALYMHDHFENYNQLLAITYLDKEGKEHWLPFINDQGRMLAPNWGRVHSMWANISVTPKINEHRLRQAIMKMTAFWGVKTGLNLDKTTFLIKMKNISMPVIWEKNLLQKNLSGVWLTCGLVEWKGKDVRISLFSPLKIFNATKY